MILNFYLHKHTEKGKTREKVPHSHSQDGNGYHRRIDHPLQKVSKEPSILTRNLTAAVPSVRAPHKGGTF